jgi:hypothetical protein
LSSFPTWSAKRQHNQQHKTKHCNHNVAENFHHKMDVDSSMTGSFSTGAGGFPNTMVFPSPPPQAPTPFSGTIAPPSNALAPQTFGLPMTPQQQPHNAILGMVVPMAPMRTDFVPADPSGTKLTLSLSSPGDLPSPLTTVSELAFFLLPGATLPPNAGLMIYWQLESPNGQSGFELLGSLIPHQRPSNIFRTGWSEHDQFQSLAPNQPAKINIGISIEPIDSVQNIAPSNDQKIATTTAIIARKIGQDLFNFMSSFDTNGAAGNQAIVVPANTFDKWWQRFERKLQRDPNFFLKNDD